MRSSAPALALAIAVLSMAAACGASKGRSGGAGRGDRATAPRRTPPGSRGPAGIALPSRPLPAVLGEGLWVALVDDASDLVVDDLGAPDPVAWIGARLDRSDAASAKTLLKVRRAAFGVHIPRSGERAPVDHDVLEDRGLAIDTDTIVLFGADTICPARRGAAIVTSLDDGGNELDVRWQLEGCPPGPWAPFGLSAPGIPTTLRWRPPTCDGVADDGPAATLGSLVEGEREVARFEDATVWISVAPSWAPRTVATAATYARGCPPVEAAPVGDESDAPADDATQSDDATTSD